MIGAFLKFLSIAKALPWGLVARVLLVGLVLLSVPAAMWVAYQAGVARTTAECTTAKQEAVIQALERQALLNQAIREADFEILMGAVQIETRTIREIQYLAAEPVVSPDCHHLGDDWLRQYNAITNAIGGAPGSRALRGTPATPRDGDR